MGLPSGSGLKLFASYRKGPGNRITDVPGVLVGHSTILDGAVNTGVTAVIPASGNLFREKVAAGAVVFNGFGKSAGLVQIQELGQLETPILMTNTLSVGTALTALVRHMLKDNADIGVSTGTVNAVVTECNDGYLNDIRGMHVTQEHCFEALEGAAEEFEEGAVGAGTGMVCFGLKGGIGTASRLVTLDGRDHTVGALTLTNFGSLSRLTIGAQRIGRRIADQLAAIGERPDRGSVIVLIATDAPLSERQLERVSMRASVALGKVGATMGNGSGDIAIAFSTANRIPHERAADVIRTEMLHSDALDAVFEASEEAIEEAVVSSLWHAAPATGFLFHRVRSLREFI